MKIFLMDQSVITTSSYRYLPTPFTHRKVFASSVGYTSSYRNLLVASPLSAPEGGTYIISEASTLLLYIFCIHFVLFIVIIFLLYALYIQR